MSTEADYYVDLINRLLGSGDYEWARETLSGIHETVSRTGRLSPKQ